MRTDEELNRVFDWANESEDSGSKYPGLSYEEGVADTLRWVLGHCDDAPDQE